MREAVEAKPLFLAYDCTRMQPGCPLLQAALGGTAGLAELFPRENWLLAPTAMLRVYPVTEAQLLWLRKQEPVGERSYPPMGAAGGPLAATGHPDCPAISFTWEKVKHLVAEREALRAAVARLEQELAASQSAAIDLREAWIVDAAEAGRPSMPGLDKIEAEYPWLAEGKR